MAVLEVSLPSSCYVMLCDLSLISLKVWFSSLPTGSIKSFPEEKMSESGSSSAQMLQYPS